MTKYERLKQELEEKGQGQMKCFGSSMMPILKSGSLITFQKQETYEVGNAVFCKVKGRYIDCHFITAVDAQKGYLISNNRGHDNGWTRTIFGRAIRAEINGTTKELK